LSWISICPPEQFNAEDCNGIRNGHRGLLQIIAYTVSSSVISGVTAVIITQLSAAPLRPVKLRVAFGVLKNGGDHF
jgi:hypothetical protein